MNEFVNNKNSRQHDFTKPFSAPNTLMMSIYFYELVLLFFIFHQNFCNNNVDNFFKGYVRCNNFSTSFNVQQYCYIQYTGQNKAKTAITGITESKLDHTLPDLEVNLSGYDILRCDRNRNGGGVACYKRKNLCFNAKPLKCKEIENICFDILLPKPKPITIGVFQTQPS